MRNEPRPRAVLRKVSDIAPEELSWLWPKRIPLGKLTLIAGDPGLGKSFITLDIAARVSRGDGWPDDAGLRCTPGGVLLFSAEDDAADTIRPRLDSMRANVERIHIVEGIETYDEKKRKQRRSFRLDRDIPRLEECLTAITDVRLVVIDPIAAYCGEIDSYKNTDVRSMLTLLAEFAARHGIAVVCITHLAKGAGGKAVYRPMDSLAFTAAARAVWLVAEDIENRERRLFLSVKLNLARAPSGLAYRIANGCVAWDGCVDISANEALAAELAKTGQNAEERKRAEDWLRQRLANGPVSAKSIFEECGECGFSKATIRRAMRKLNVVSKREGGIAGSGNWEWRLPGDNQNAEDDETPDSKNG